MNWTGSPFQRTLLKRSAEELLAFMIWGLEPASRTELADTWEVGEPDGDRAIVSVSRLSACLFSVSVERRLARTGHILKVDYAFDFTAVRDYSAWRANAKTKGSSPRSKENTGTTKE